MTYRSLWSEIEVFALAILVVEVVQLWVDDRPRIQSLVWLRWDRGDVSGNEGVKELKSEGFRCPHGKYCHRGS